MHTLVAPNESEFLQSNVHVNEPQTAEYVIIGQTLREKPQ
jgi:hypothetical protein